MKKTASVLGLFALSLFLVCCALAEAEFPLRSDIHFGDTMEDILSKEKTLLCIRRGVERIPRAKRLEAIPLPSPAAPFPSNEDTIAHFPCFDQSLPSAFQQVLLSVAQLPKPASSSPVYPP